MYLLGSKPVTLITEISQEQKELRMLMEYFDYSTKYFINIRNSEEVQKRGFEDSRVAIFFLSKTPVILKLAQKFCGEISFLAIIDEQISNSVRKELKNFKVETLLLNKDFRSQLRQIDNEVKKLHNQEDKKNYPKR